MNTSSITQPGICNDHPVVSIITVTRNNAAGLESTLRSVAMQTYKDVELLVIDGDSTDHTPEVLAAHQSLITRSISEPDAGIYDAMNKGIALARGQWLVFMNAGDCLDQPRSLEDAMALATDQVQVIYSDAYFGAARQLAVCSHTPLRVIHQAMVYRRSLHATHGRYLCMPRVTISDYLFFVSIAHHPWVKCDKVIAHCEGGGVSTRPRTYAQKLAVDLLADRAGSIKVGCMLLAYPCYRVLIRPWVRLLRPSRI